MLPFDHLPFPYHADQPPLYFVVTEPRWNDRVRNHLQQLNHEFNRLSRERCVYNTCMSNGMTLGEYAIYVLKS
jgi:hypothetical protein